ncbi:MAG: tRNA1(Val) (adenine(37)-N6)-methyltransferase [Vicingaceae bacterium]
MSEFEFKHFSISQENTAMKVGTDGVLLGAWSINTEGTILDIGTGTGLIAIMLAQRTKTALIDAIEVERIAYQQAKENIQNCKWSNRIKAHHLPIQEFKSHKKYDTIISNPPFFTNSTKAPKTERNTARHTDNLSFNDLIESVVRHLKPTGIFSLILPITESEHFIELAIQKHLFLNRKCIVQPNPTKPAKRVLMEFSFEQKELIKETLIIETETRHQYTKEYISLTQDFYLKF